jgi:hypothetical protein
MIKITLPGRIELRCTACREAFKVEARQLHGRRELSCPFCRETVDLYNSMSPTERRQIYYAIRDALEQRIYDLKRESGELEF